MNEKEKSFALGGQAVIEGVMIRSRSYMVISIRKQNGEIQTISEEINLLSRKYRLLQLPFIRGILAVFETLHMGFKSLFRSAKIVLEEEGEMLSYKELILTIVMVVALSSFFIVIPLLLATLFTATGLIFNIIETIVRLIIFLIFLKLVSLWSEYKKVLQYHGAEHKAINAYEAGAPLNLTVVKRHSRLHPRCGTSFIFILVLVSILLFSIIPNSTFLMRLVSRVVLIPIIGAVSYEILIFSGKHRNLKIMKIIGMPGLGLQYLTTKEPDDDMVVVALRAVNEANKLSLAQK